MQKIKVFDATLRDGSHANQHQFSEGQIERYCTAVDCVGLDAVFVGHGNGLGASSAQVGFSKCTDPVMLTVARKNLHKTKLGAYMMPGFGTIKDQIIPALECGVDIFEVGSHCTEADVTEQHIRYIRDQGKEVYGTLMMYHLADTQTVTENAKKMESYGANGVIIMDSAGASTQEMVEKTFQSLSQNLNIPVGFHGHNNLGLGVSNTYTALQYGARLIDASMRGYGAGAGNCELETICALLYKENKKIFQTNVNLQKLLDASEEVMDEIAPNGFGVSPISVVSGISGVFSAFKNQAICAGKEFGVDPKAILMEVGRRNAIGGQEDVIVQIAKELSGKGKA